MINFFRTISYLEGISYLLLFFVTMPLKRIYGYLEPNLIVGYTHGALFITYILLAFMVKKEKQWDIKTLGIVLLCSLIPFATFWMDRKYLAKS
ncbi:hypothetical protein GCM10022393_38590 [Aquimarina addita]|uniref:DUF3817 domain-containing protein n=1 Tax=Aquimarina addita TaxID=870485 RepID=A0ABP6UVI4_9FLAO